MTDQNGTAPPIVQAALARKAPTPEQQEARAAVDARNTALQATRLPMPSTGIFGSQKNKPQPKVKP
jgi:hypothetical protein